MTRLPVHEAMTISAIMRIPVIWREIIVLRTGLSNSEGQFKFLNLLAYKPQMWSVNDLPYFRAALFLSRVMVKHCSSLEPTMSGWKLV